MQQADISRMRLGHRNMEKKKEKDNDPLIFIPSTSPSSFFSLSRSITNTVC